MGTPMDTPLTGAGVAGGVVAGVIGIMLTVTVGTTGMVRGATALRMDTHGLRRARRLRRACRRRRWRLPRRRWRSWGWRRPRALSDGERGGHRRVEPFAQSAARVAVLEYGRSGVESARARAGRAASAVAATELRRPGPQSILEQRQPVRQLSAKAAASAHHRPGNSAGDATAIFPHTIHLECGVLRALPPRAHSERRRSQRVAAQPGGQR